MQVRKLKTKDLFKVANILSKMSKAAIQEMKAEINEQQLGFIFLQSALAHAEEELKAWLADLAGMDVADFDEQPLETTLEIIEQIQKENDLQNFFNRVKVLRQKFSLKS